MVRISFPLMRHEVEHLLQVFESDLYFIFYELFLAFAHLSGLNFPKFNLTLIKVPLPSLQHRIEYGGGVGGLTWRSLPLLPFLRVGEGAGISKLSCPSMAGCVSAVGGIPLAQPGSDGFSDGYLGCPGLVFICTSSPFPPSPAPDHHSQKGHHISLCS